MTQNSRVETCDDVINFFNALQKIGEINNASCSSSSFRSWLMIAISTSRKTSQDSWQIRGSHNWSLARRYWAKVTVRRDKVIRIFIRDEAAYMVISCSVFSKSLPDSKYCHSETLETFWMTQWLALILKGQREASLEAHESEKNLVPPLSAAWPVRSDMKKLSLAEYHSWFPYAKVRLEIREDACQLGLHDRV